MIQIYVDGLAEPNPGVGTFGYAIFRDDTRLVEKSGFAGPEVTNNYSEYTALTEALSAALEFRDDEVTVFSDSKLLVNQMSGEWKVSKKAFNSRGDGSYVEKYLEAKELAGRFGKISFVWIPREQNTLADELSRVAYREQLLMGGRMRSRREP